MADSSVAADIHQTLDVHLYCRTELTLDLVLFSNHATDPGDLLVVPFPDLGVKVDAKSRKDLPG